jgi:RNA-directed DNA polymerase
MYENLMDEVVTEENRKLALKAVTQNKGAEGIDRMKTTELENHLQANWEKIRAKLLKGTYIPTPVRKVEIPKPSGGTRTLGIPTVQDRFIQQMLLQALTPIFDSMFSDHSYGFRPGRSAHEAVRAAQKYAQEGKDWVVDIDITKFFDHVNHDILIGRIGTTIRDKRVLGLIGKYLRRGAMVDGVAKPSEEGTPQGGPLTPRTQKITLNSRGECDFCGNRVRIDVCHVRFYFYDRCPAPAKTGKPSGSIARANCCSRSISFPKPSGSWRRTARFRRVRPTATSNKPGN